MRRVAILAAVVLACLLGGRLHAQPWDDDEDEDVPAVDLEKRHEDDFWGSIAKPNFSRYLRALRIAREERNKSRYAAAEIRYQEAAALEPTEIEPYYELGTLYTDMKRWNDCAAALVEVRKLRPDFADNEFSFKAGFCLSLANRYEESIEEYKRYQPPANTRSVFVKHWNMGDSYMALGRLEEAIGAYRLAVQANDQEGMPHFALGVALDRDEQLAAAREEVQQGLRRNPGLDEFQSTSIYFVPPEEKNYYLGFIQEERGNRAVAIANWRMFLSKQPDGPWSVRAKDHLRELAGPRPSEREVVVAGSQPAGADRAAILKALHKGMAELEKCLAGEPAAVVRVDLSRVAGNKNPARVDVSPGQGPQPPSARAVACLRPKLEKLALPALKTGAQTVIFPVIAP